MAQADTDCTGAFCMITAMLNNLVGALDRSPSHDPQVIEAHRTARMFLSAFEHRGVLHRPCADPAPNQHSQPPPAKTFPE